MTLETDLAETFADHERLAPDANQVMTAVRARTATRRPNVRPWAVAATIVALGAVVTGAVAAVSDGSGRLATTTQVVGSASTTPTAPASVGPAALTMPLDLGWLPDGAVTYVARRTTLGTENPGAPTAVSGGEYIIEVDTASTSLNIDVQQLPGNDLAAATFKSGPGSTVNVGGKAGVESTSASDSTGGYELYFLDAAGRDTYVNVANSTVNPGHEKVSSDVLRDIGRRIAESVTVPGITAVTPSFGVGQLPKGMQVLAFAVESDVTGATSGPPVTSYVLGAPGSKGDVTVSEEAGRRGGATTPGRSAQGHPTLTDEQSGQRVVVVQDAVDGRPVAIAGTLSFDELYDVADGLILPS